MYGVFGRRKKQEAEPQPNQDSYQKKLEVVNKNIDLGKLSSEIERFLSNSKDPFDFATYTVRDFPEKKLRLFKIEHGIRSPTTKMLILIEGDGNNLKILDHIPRNNALYAEALLISPVIFFPSIMNAQAYYIKLWNFIGKTIKSLEA